MYREIKGNSLSSLRKRFELGDIDEKLILLEEAKISGDQLRITLLLRAALQSDDYFIQGVAIQHIFSASKNDNGIWKRSHNRYSTGSFGFRISETEITSTAVNFKGNFFRQYIYKQSYQRDC